MIYNIDNFTSEAHTTGVQQKWAGMNPSGQDHTWERGPWLLRGRINKKKIDLLSNYVGGMVWNVPFPVSGFYIKHQSQASQGTFGSNIRVALVKSS